ncbi:DUF6438 domain-containing protein [Tenacibaculum sp. IB213877]|uniref:DUF6438 domain-containing protein n=1 Tax=Tenacibaculum sp. IB213877 TaxID=3097351 RepID=UPI002A59C7D0|nr:DUF6438 domain-containing protein [Tenacibaculum sp. IB213877]MDY0779877.1 DUF6438 domain-containing protein [Tenacibaculum sp. IB213877]
MKFIYLSLFLLVLSCGTPKNTSDKEETKTEEKEAPKAVKDELIVVLNNPKNVEAAKALITNSGLQWEKLIFDTENTKIALIKVPAEKRDFWLERLQQSEEFKSVELNGIMTAQKAIERAKSPLFSIKKTPCFGDCPVYEVTINSDGKLTYNGKEYVIEKGIREIQLSEEQFTTLKEKLTIKDFSSFKDVYDNPKITDLPSTYITYKGKQIKIRLWTDEVPTELIAVNEYVQDILLENKFFE